jgi:hypothetical protein
LSPNGLTLCRIDAAYLADELAWVADRDLAEDLMTTFVRADRMGPQARRAGHDRPLPWSEHGSAALRHLDVVLATWSGALDPDPVPIGLAERARAIRRALPALRASAQSDRIYTEIITAVYEARVAVDIPAESSRFEVGPCPEWTPTDDDPNRLTHCDGTVMAYIGRGDTPSVMTCRACRTSWGTSEWLRAGRRILRRMTDRPARAIA